MKNLRLFLSATALAAASVALRAAPEAEAATGRALMKRHADAIVGIELVVTVKMKMGEREAPPTERRIEVNGTVISPTGLTVTSLVSVDPQMQFDSARSAQGGMRGVELVGAEFKEVKLRLADGKEVAARFVLKDADLDLAFMAPESEDAGRTFPFVSLAEAAEGKVMETYYLVARASKSLQRVAIGRTSEVLGVVEKPRRVYLLTEQMLGMPIFDPQGKVLGISLQHFAGGRMSGMVVLPAPDIADMAKQAAAVQRAPKATQP